MLWINAAWEFFIIIMEAGFPARFIFVSFFWNRIRAVIIFFILIIKLLRFFIFEFFNSDFLRIWNRIFLKKLLNYKVSCQMLICLINTFSINNHNSFILVNFLRFGSFIKVAFTIFNYFSKIFSYFVLRLFRR